MKSQQQIQLTNRSHPNFSEVWQVGGDAYTAPCVVAKTGGTTNWYYVLRDHLGTITHITNASGTVLNEYSFDAWGRRRNFSNWGYTVAAQTDLLPARGFTAHEWLPWFNLYNMNGRLYDPVVGRFLSPDNYVQMPDFSQNFNRYSYCWNNPLKYNDPDGEWLWIPLMIVGAYIGGVSNNSGELNPTKWDWKDPFTYISMGVGGLVGYFGGYGIINPGTVGLTLGASSPYVAAGITASAGATALGEGTNWKFDLHWSTSAGGRGGLPLNYYSSTPEQIGYSAITNTRNTYGRAWRVNSITGEIWNSDFMRRNTGDAIFINTGLNLTYFGGGSDNAGIILPLRGPDAFSPHWINTASFRLGGQLGFDALTKGKAWYNGPVNEAYMSYISGYGNSIDFNAGVVFGFGPGGGLFAGYDENDITWYGHYRSVGWGAGGSLGFDYTTVRPIFRKKRKR